MEITTNTLSEAHEAACDVIMSQHKEIYIQTHVDKKEFTLEFESPSGGDDIMVLHILHPGDEPQVSAGSNYGPLLTEAYKKQFLTLSPPREDGKHATYTYWNRLEDYPHVILDRLKGNGDGGGYKQVTELVEKLANDPNSRRGVMVTWSPMLDSKSLEPPCMDMVQLVIRKGRLHIRVVFRSQDMLLGLAENLVGVRALQCLIVEWINRLGIITVEAGEVTLVSLIPHIYKKRDTSDFEKLRAYIHEKKTYGKWHPRIK
jgi:thymidylate synthase